MAEKKYLDADGVKTLWDKVVQKIPTKTSDLTNDSGFLNVTLADVATSGSYADLSDKPEIPAVNNATLTVQQNGKSVGTFTANSSENKTINIEVPTKISDLENDLNLSSYATESYVDTKVSDLVNSAPETLDTLNELASALGNDPNFATTVSNQIGNKANDSDVVHKSGNETISDVKTFSNAIVGDLTGTASKATADADGNVITDTYVKLISINYATDADIEDIFN